MKISANIIMDCPNCGKTLILSEPIKQESISGMSQVKQKCGECKQVITMYFELTLKMWDAK